MKVLLLDGYVDEPAQLGVPPYISTYVRYAYGVYAQLGVEPAYLTIDQLRQQEDWNVLNDFDHLVVIGGVSVPGKYVGGKPIRLGELERIGTVAREPLKILFGPFTSGYTVRGGSGARDVSEHLAQLFDCPVTGNLETFLYHLVRGSNPPESISYDPGVVGQIAPFGAGVVSRHPRFPHVICEIELSRGCERKSHCSFCTEPVFSPGYTERPVSEVLEEIDALAKRGAVHFRLGRAANVLAYGNRAGRPNPDALERLYAGIRERVPGLRTLHTDNASPITIATFPTESAQALEVIARYNTQGDSLSLGVESFDPEVSKRNGLGLTPNMALQAIRIINRVGAFRKPDVPALLPGLNFLFGLPGESRKTGEINFEVLRQVAQEGLMLRRINIRQVMVFPGTPLWEYRNGHALKFFKKEFAEFKKKVRTQLDPVFLQRVFPLGTRLSNVVTEFHEGNITFGRQLGTYPVLVGIRQKLPLGQQLDVRVTEYGMRSLTGEVVE